MSFNQEIKIRFAKSKEPVGTYMAMDVQGAAELLRRDIGKSDMFCVRDTKRGVQYYLNRHLLEFVVEQKGTAYRINRRIKLGKLGL